MSERFTPVGIPIAGSGDFDTVLPKIMGGTPTYVPVPPDSWLLPWRDPSGGGLDVLLTGEGEIHCATPQYIGDSRQRVRLTGWTPNECAGCVLALVDLLDDSDEQLLPLAVSTTEVAVGPARHAIGSVLDASLVVLALQVDVYPDEAAFDLAQQAEWAGEGLAGFAAHSMVPVGLFGSGVPTATVQAYGTVLDSRQRESETFGLPFWHLLVRSYGGTFDVMVAADKMSRVDSGAVVAVRGTMCGRIGLT